MMVVGAYCSRHKLKMCVGSMLRSWFKFYGIAVYYCNTAASRREVCCIISLHCRREVCCIIGLRLSGHAVHYLFINVDLI